MKEENNILETCISIIFIFIIGILIIGILFMVLMVQVNAEVINITPSEASWYDWNSNIVATTQVSEIARGGDTFKVWQTSNTNAEAMSTNIYFNESYNDRILANRYDISFSMLAYGDITIRLGQYSCFYTNTYTISDFYTNGGQYNNETTVNTHYPKYYDVFCPNVKVNSLPVKLTMFRAFNNGTSSQDRLAISKYWGFAQTNNAYNDTNVINAINGIGSSISSAINNSQNNSTNTIINNQNNNTQSILNEGQNVQPDAPPQEIQDINEDEESLLESINEIEQPELEIDLDQNSNEWVWTNLTNFISVNANVLGMFITILILGVIKTILGR